MTAKEYLGQARKINALINSKQRMLKKLRKEAESLQAVNTNGDTVKSSTVPDPMRTIDRIVDLEREVDEYINKQIDILRDVTQSIDRVLVPDYIAILTDRYVNCLTLESIAEEYEVSYRTVCVRLGQALQIFRKENNMT